MSSRQAKIELADFALDQGPRLRCKRKPLGLALLSGLAAMAAGMPSSG